MPNVITNKLIISGEQEQIDTLLKFVLTEDKSESEGIIFDFNRIIPLPIFRNKEISSALTNLGKYTHIRSSYCIENSTKYTYYPFAGIYWTTGNSANTCVENNIIIFETARCAVPMLICILSSLFPTVELTYLFSDDCDATGSSGIFKFKAGECLVGELPERYTPLAYNLYYHVFGEHCNVYSHLSMHILNPYNPPELPPTVEEICNQYQNKKTTGAG